jgi:hypothetical protein
MRIRYHLGGRLPEAYRAWVEDDIASPEWPFRHFAARLPVTLLFILPVSLFMSAEMARWFLLAGYLTVGIAAWMSYAMRDADRKAALARHRRYWKEN